VSKFKTYIDETVNEMRHNVSWPTWKELQSNTIIVVVASVIFALLIFVMDFAFGISGEEKSVWKGLLGFIYQMFN
jgi:preprotein translocase subunit SecE